MEQQFCPPTNNPSHPPPTDKLPHFLRISIPRALSRCSRGTAGFPHFGDVCGELSSSRGVCAHPCVHGPVFACMCVHVCTYVQRVHMCI